MKESTEAVIVSKKYMFGDKDYEDAYYQAVEKIIDSNLFRVYKKNTDRDGYVSITICNLFRIEKDINSRKVELSLYDLETKEWNLIKPDDHRFPMIFLLPINKCMELNEFCYFIMQFAIKYVIEKQINNLKINGGLNPKLLISIIIAKVLNNKKSIYSKDKKNSN